LPVILMISGVKMTLADAGVPSGPLVDAIDATS
jgi:hypothetical protein